MTDFSTDEFRVRSWDEFVGQQPTKDLLDLHIRAHCSANDPVPLPHILLAGPPGFGKTSLAAIVASRSVQPFYPLKMPVRPPALADFFRRFVGGVVFLDEIHAAPKRQQEDLLPVVEDGYFHTPNGRRYELPWLTVIAATTEPHKVIAPLFDRFPIRPSFDSYTDDDMTRIVMGMAERVGVDLDEEDARLLGRATGGIPRRARGFLCAARAQARTGTKPTAESVLRICRVDADGLDPDHHAYLRALDELGGRRGFDMICSYMRQHPSVVRDLERLLLDRRYVELANGGRELTQEGVRRLRTANV